MEQLKSKIMRKSDREYDSIKALLELSRSQTAQQLNESENKEDEGEAIAITNDARFGQQVLTNQISAFKKSVSGGAKFASENSEDPESNPLVFYPKSGNLIFSGSIPSMSDLKFQFSLNDVTNAPYIFVDGLALTEDVLNTLKKLYGYYRNWKSEWEVSSDLLDKLKKEED